MTRLERRAQLLLRAYPAGYRRDRGEEIADTLLEATPAGRDWPLPRESRALVMAGLRARAAANGRLGTQTGLRLAAQLGIAVYLALWAALNAADGWQYAPLVLLTIATVAAGWLDGRIAKKVAAAAVVAVIIYSRSSGGSLIWALLPVACLAVFASLAAGPRPPRAWLWMPAAVALTGPVLFGLALPLTAGRGYADLVADGTVLAVVTVLAAAVLWIAVDARPVIGLLVTVSLFGMETSAGLPHPSVRSVLTMLAAWLLAPAVLAALALWRLRRQAALSGRMAA